MLELYVADIATRLEPSTIAGATAADTGFRYYTTLATRVVATFAFHGWTFCHGCPCCGIQTLASRK